MRNFPMCTFTSRWHLSPAMAEEDGSRRKWGGWRWGLGVAASSAFNVWTFYYASSRAAPRGTMSWVASWAVPPGERGMTGRQPRCLSYDTNKSLQLLSDWRRYLGNSADWLAGREASVQCQYNEKMPIPKWMCKWNGYKARSQLTDTHTSTHTFHVLNVSELHWSVSNPFNLNSSRSTSEL